MAPLAADRAGRAANGEHGSGATAATATNVMTGGNRKGGETKAVAMTQWWRNNNNRSGASAAQRRRNNGRRGNGIKTNVETRWGHDDGKAMLVSKAARHQERWLQQARGSGKRARRSV